MSKNDVRTDKDKMAEEVYANLERRFVENSQAPADEESTASGKAKTGTAANSRYVRVRKGASGSSPVVTVMNAGETAEILDRVPGFYKIKTTKGGHVGFVASNYFVED